jgi:NADH-Ubiquinone oxidoreductase (complex I), chain 5 N-terminus/Proton-conducting membrane transporter
MYFAFICLCVWNYLFTLIISSRIGERSAARRRKLISFALFCCSLYMFYEVCIKRVPTAIELTYWINIADIEICWSFFFDSFSCTMILVIITIYLFVVVYSMDYMCDNSTKIRFFSSLALFACAMINLVVAGNIIQLILGWELVGISSYMLIGYWYRRNPGNKAAQGAILINKIGDNLLHLSTITFLILYLYLNIEIEISALFEDTGPIQCETVFKKAVQIEYEECFKRFESERKAHAKEDKDKDKDKDGRFFLDFIDYDKISDYSKRWEPIKIKTYINYPIHEFSYRNKPPVGANFTAQFTHAYFMHYFTSKHEQFSEKMLAYSRSCETAGESSYFWYLLSPFIAVELGTVSVLKYISPNYLGYLADYYMYYVHNVKIGYAFLNNTTFKVDFSKTVYDFVFEGYSLSYLTAGLDTTWLKEATKYGQFKPDLKLLDAIPKMKILKTGMMDAIRDKVEEAILYHSRSPYERMFFVNPSVFKHYQCLSPELNRRIIASRKAELERIKWIPQLNVHNYINQYGKIVKSVFYETIRGILPEDTPEEVRFKRFMYKFGISGFVQEIFEKKEHEYKKSLHDVRTVRYGYGGNLTREVWTKKPGAPEYVPYFERKLLEYRKFNDRPYREITESFAYHKRLTAHLEGSQVLNRIPGTNDYEFVCPLLPFGLSGKLKYTTVVMDDFNFRMGVLRRALARLDMLNKQDIIFQAYGKVPRNFNSTSMMSFKLNRRPIEYVVFDELWEAKIKAKAKAKAFKAYAKEKCKIST